VDTGSSLENATKQERQGAPMPLTHVLIALVVVVLWGLNFIVMKHIASELPPLAITGLRFLLAAVPLVFLVARPKVSWQALLGFGLFFGVIKFGLLFTAFAQGMPAGLASLVLQMQSAFYILFAFMLLGERPLPLQWFGLTAALVGALIIAWGKASGATFFPTLLTIAAAISWGIANVFIRREGQFDALPFAIWSSLMPGIVMLLLSGLVDGPQTVATSVTNLSWKGLGALAYLAWPISILTGTIWGYLMIRHSAATIAPFALLVPVVGLISGWVVYGETQTLSTWTGAGLIGLGLIMTVLASRSAAHHARANKA
jgi:O-acetylserine/cysteine efflux transporter